MAATANPAGAASSLLPAHKQAEDVVAFGGDEYRNHFSEDQFGTGLCASWALDLGRSASQPLVVGNRAFHLAGDGLWAVRLDQDVPPGLSPDEVKQELVIWHKAGLQSGATDSSPTDSSPVYSDTEVTTMEGTHYRGIIYAITGPVPGSSQRSVVAVAAEDGTLLGRAFLPAVSFISSPLVFPGDVLVFGSTDGRLWSARGVTREHFKEPVVNWVPVNGTISGSFVPVGATDFLVGLDHPNKLTQGGTVMRYGLDLKPRWVTPAGTPAFTNAISGIPASFAEDDSSIVYFSDRIGMFYAIRSDTGEIVWQASLPGPEYVNNSPALDAEYVYYTIRKGSSGSGELVAFRRDGIGGNEPAWRAVLPALGTTAPLIWADAGGVLVGDTSGRVTAWRAPRPGEPTGIGQPLPFATQLSCSQIGHVATVWGNNNNSRKSVLQNELRLTDSPFQDKAWWAMGSGASTELTLSHGYLLTGANSTNQDVFLAFKPGKPVNLELTGQVVVDGPVEPGQRLPVQLHIESHSPQPVRTMIAHGWASGQPNFEFVDLGPQESRWIGLDSAPVPDGAAQYVAVINPLGYDLTRRGTFSLLEPLPSNWEGVLYGQVSPPPEVRVGLQRLDAAGSAVIYETTVADNYWRQNIRVGDPVDLQMTDLSAPAWIPAPVPPDDPRYPVTAVIHNTGDKAVDTSIRLVIQSLSMQGQSLTRPVHLEPGDNTVTIYVPGSMPGDTITVRVLVNPDRNVSESDYTNNSGTVVTHVEDAPPPPPAPPDAGKVDDVLRH
jgi:outer membrane protein assembly factor BamB